MYSNASCITNITENVKEKIATSWDCIAVQSVDGILFYLQLYQITTVHQCFNIHIFMIKVSYRLLEF